MKKLLLALVFLFSIINVFSQPSYLGEVVVGKQPALIIEDTLHSGFHIFCMGYDSNYDGKYEAEEEKPSWWYIPIEFPTQIGNNFNVEKVKEFDHPIGEFFIRPAVSKNKIYFAQNDIVYAYDFRDGLENLIVRDITPVALSIYENNLFLSLRKNDGNDVIVVYDLKNEKYIDTIEAYVNVQMTLPVLDGKYLLVLNEGNFGAEDSKLQIIDLMDNNKEIAVFDIGGAGTYVAYDANTDNIAVAMNGSNQVKLITLKNKEIINSFNLPTEAFDGPRFLQFIDNGASLLVSCYDANIYNINVQSGNVLKYLELKSKAEGFFYGNLLANNEFLLIANSMVKNTYDPDSTVSFYANFSSVEDRIRPLSINIYPNPVSDYLNIIPLVNIDLVDVSIVEIYSSTAKLMKKVILYADSRRIITLNELDLPSGKYYLRMKNGKNVFQGTFIVL